KWEGLSQDGSMHNSRYRNSENKKTGKSKREKNKFSSSLRRPRPSMGCCAIYDDVLLILYYYKSICIKRINPN
ncbi:hypothetical protein L9F63_024133, partial [Diploptera punctata]